MPLKSIVDIDVNDTKFREFAALFDRYRDDLAGTSGAWGKVAQSTNAAGAALDAMTKKHNVEIAMGRLDMEARRRAAELFKRQDNEALGRIGRLKRETESWGSAVGKVGSQWKSVATYSAKTSTHIASATVSLLKWTSVLGAASALIGGAGGLFGIDRLAASAASGRRSSTGLGVGYGQQRAFSLDYSRFVDAEGMLANVAGALSDKTSNGYRGLLGAGISAKYADTHDAADVSVEVLKRLPEIFKGVQPGLIGPTAQARGLTDILSVEDIKRYLAASPEERQKQEQAYRRDSKGLDVDPAVSRAWQDLTTQLGRAGEQIETTFIIGLKPLAKPIDDASKAFADLTAAFLKSDVVKTGIEGLAGGLESAAKFVGTQEFKDDIKYFVDGVGDLAKGVRRALEWLGLLPNKAGAPVVPDPVGNLMSGLNPDDGHANIWNRGFNRGKHGVLHPDDLTDDQIAHVRGKARKFGGNPQGAKLGDRATYTGPRGPVPGANGYGAIDAPYTGRIDAKGERGILSPKELHDYLIKQGATEKEATMLTGAAGNESSFNPNANHDPAYPGGPPQGHGLWGHKHTRIDMRGMTWQQEADAALAEVKKKYAGRVNAAKTPEELADAEVDYERPRGFHPWNPRGGDNYTGRYHTIERFSKEFGTFGPEHHARGGVVGGQGGPNSDRVPAMLSPGEFVVNAAMTARYLPFLHAMNSGLSHFAKGGRVPPPKLTPGVDAKFYPDGRHPPRVSDKEADENRRSWSAFLRRPRSQGGMGASRATALGTMAMLAGETGYGLNHHMYNWDVNGPSGGVDQLHDVTKGKYGGVHRLTDAMATAMMQHVDFLQDRTFQQANFKHEADGPLAFAWGPMSRAKTAMGALTKGVDLFENPAQHQAEIRRRSRYIGRLVHDRVAAAKAAEGLQRTAMADDGAGTPGGAGPARGRGLSDTRFQRKSLPMVTIANNTGANVNVTAAMAGAMVGYG